MRPQEHLTLSQVTLALLSEKCRALAQKRGLPDRGFSSSQISKFFNGKANPKEYQRRIIEAALGVEDLIQWPQIKKEKGKGVSHDKSKEKDVGKGKDLGRSYQS